MPYADLAIFSKEMQVDWSSLKFPVGLISCNAGARGGLDGLLVGLKPLEGRFHDSFGVKSGGVDLCEACDSRVTQP